MNGPEHYTEAQRVLEMDAHVYGALYALTHAVLALVAASVENDGEAGFSPDEIHRWEAIGAVGKDGE
jgi:hypothetical protein